MQKKDKSCHAPTSPTQKKAKERRIKNPVKFSTFNFEIEYDRILSAIAYLI